MNLYPLNGSWISIKQELGGMELSANDFQGQKLIFSDNYYIFMAESTDKGVLEYKNGIMDIYSKEGVNAGKHFTAIYTLENSILTICYNLSSENYPTAFETESSSKLFISVFQKEII